MLDPVLSAAPPRIEATLTILFCRDASKRQQKSPLTPERQKCVCVYITTSFTHVHTLKIDKTTSLQV